MTNEIPRLLDDLETNTKKAFDEIQATTDHDHLENIKRCILDQWKLAYNEIKRGSDCIENKITIMSKTYPESDKLTMQLIAQYCLKKNEKQIVESLINEGHEYLREMVDDYNFLIEIEGNIKKGNYENLAILIENNKEYFDVNKKLVFYYQVLSYLSLLKNGRKSEGLFYFQKNFRTYLDCEDFCNEIRKIITLLVFNENLGIFIKQYTEKLQKRLKIDYTLLKDIPKTNTLELLVNGSKESLPSMLKASEMIDSHKIASYNDGDEIPVDLKVKTKFHSIFICPVLKTFCGKDNPPMLLMCGHVISKEAMLRITKTGEVVTFKCPYCPTECIISRVKQLFL